MQLYFPRSTAHPGLVAPKLVTLVAVPVP